MKIQLSVFGFLAIITVATHAQPTSTIGVDPSRIHLTLAYADPFPEEYEPGFSFEVGYTFKAPSDRLYRTTLAASYLSLPLVSDKVTGPSAQQFLLTFSLDFHFSEGPIVPVASIAGGFAHLSRGTLVANSGYYFTSNHESTENNAALVSEAGLLFDIGATAQFRLTGRLAFAPLSTKQVAMGVGFHL